MTTLALGLLWRRQRSILDQWVLAATFATFLELSIGLFVPARFDLGWYASRMFPIVTSTSVLLVLLAELTTLYRHAFLLERQRSIGQFRAANEQLARAVEEASTLALVGARSTGIRMGLQLDPTAALAFIDKVQIQQVLVNLIRNAAEAMQESQQRELIIATAAAAPQGMIEIAVSDTGPGIAPQVRERLFQPFVTTKGAGIGIGLSICRAIVEDGHGGRLWAEDNPAGGTVFRLTLPVDPST